MDLGNISLKDNEINAGGLNIPILKGEKGERGEQRKSWYSRHTRRKTEKLELAMY